MNIQPCAYFFFLFAVIRFLRLGKGGGVEISQTFHNGGRMNDGLLVH